MAATNQGSKKALIAEQILKKKKCDKLALTIVHRLIEDNVDKNQFLKDAAFIAPHHMDDVIDERQISGLCGWVLCDEKLGAIPKQQYKIQNNRVLDITERKKFCSSKCYGIAIHFKSQMMTSPLWLRDEEPIPDFTILEPNSTKDELHGLTLRLNGLNMDDVKDESEDEECDDY